MSIFVLTNKDQVVLGPGSSCFARLYSSENWCSGAREYGHLNYFSTRGLCKIMDYYRYNFDINEKIIHEINTIETGDLHCD